MVILYSYLLRLLNESSGVRVFSLALTCFPGIPREDSLASGEAVKSCFATDLQKGYELGYETFLIHL